MKPVSFTPSGSSTRCFRNLSKLSLRDLDDATEHFEAGKPAVSPQRARLEIERHRTERRDVRRERVAVAASRRGTRALIAETTAHQPRAMCQQIAHRDLASRRNEIGHRSLFVKLS